MNLGLTATGRTIHPSGVVRRATPEKAPSRRARRPEAVKAPVGRYATAGGLSNRKLGAQGAGRQNQEKTPKTSRSCSAWEGVSPRVGASPDAGRRSAIA